MLRARNKLTLAKTSSYIAKKHPLIPSFKPCRACPQKKKSYETCLQGLRTLQTCHRESYGGSAVVDDVFIEIVKLQGIYIYVCMCYIYIDNFVNPYAKQQIYMILRTSAEGEK